MQVSPADYTLVTDEYGNHYAEFDFSGQPAGTIQTVKIDYHVTVNELAYDCRSAKGHYWMILSNRNYISNPAIPKL